MQQSLALLAAHVLVVVAEHEAHGGEEVALAGTIAADDNVALGREGLDLGLVLVALEALDGDLFDVAHGGGAGAMCVSSGRAGGGTYSGRVWVAASSGHAAWREKVFWPLARNRPVQWTTRTRTDATWAWASVLSH